jgi:acetyl esterase/lipase
MITARHILPLLLLTSPLAAVELRTERDLAYVKDGHERQKLDVYAPTEGKDHPVLVFIHGGGWRRGEKTLPSIKVNALAEQGFVTVSIAYRFFPDVTVKQMMGDVAKAIRWVRDHAKDYGGDPDKLFVMGHSAGAHLAALVCTDDRYLKAEGVPLASIRGCIPIDVSVYDIPKRMAMTGSVGTGNFKELFGEASETQIDYSPFAHVAQGKDIPAFLILHVADRPETKEQSHHFADALKAAGVEATVVAGEGKTHGTINSELTTVDDDVTKAFWSFVKKHR